MDARQAPQEAMRFERQLKHQTSCRVAELAEKVGFEGRGVEKSDAWAFQIKQNLENVDWIGDEAKLKLEENGD